MKYAASLASCIWKALGFVLRLIHTDYAKCYIARHWKLARRGFQHEDPPPTHTHWKNTGRRGWVPASPPLVPTPMNFWKHLLTDWLGVSTVELCGWKKRDLGGILRYVRAQKCMCGAGDLLPPPSLESGGGGERPFAPPVPTPMILYIDHWANFPLLLRICCVTGWDHILLWRR